jgi:hypothetical protein
MFTMILIDPYHDGFLERYNSLVSLYASFNSGNSFPRFFILGVHKRTTNIAILSELGRFPLYFNIIKGMLLFWYRLENLGKEFPLLKEAYNETKLLYLSKKPSWYGSINIIVNILKATNTDINLHILLCRGTP